MQVNALQKLRLSSVLYASVGQFINVHLIEIPHAYLRSFRGNAFGTLNTYLDPSNLTLVLVLLMLLNRAQVYKYFR